MANATEGDTSTEGAGPTLTLDQIKALFAEERAANAAAMNAAITGHTKRLKKDFDEKLAKLSAPAKTDEDGDDEPTADPKAALGGQPAKDAKVPAQADPFAERFAKLEAETAKRIKRLEDEAKDAKAQAAKAERSRVEERGYASLRSALTGKVSVGAEDAVLDILRARGRVVIGDDGSVRMRGITKDEPDEGLDLEGGVTAFIKSDEAKFFVPPPTAGPANTKRSQSFGNAPAGANVSGPRDAVDAFEAKHGAIAKSLI